MMKEGDVHKLWPGLHLHMRYDIQEIRLYYWTGIDCSLLNVNRGVCILSHLPWIPDIRNRLPWFTMPLWPIARKWSANRLRNPSQKKDIWYHLVRNSRICIVMSTR